MQSKFSRVPSGISTALPSVVTSFEPDMSDRAVQELDRFVQAKRLDIISRAKLAAAREQSPTIEYRHIATGIREVG